MYFTVLSVLIIILGTVLVFLQMQKGERLGFERAAIDLGVTIASAFLAALFSDWCSGMMRGSAENLLRNVGVLNAIEQLTAQSNKLLEMLAEPFAALMIYIPVFLIIKAIASVAVNNISQNLEVIGNRGSYTSENESFLQRESYNIGKICGIISGVVLTVILVTPFAGTFKICKQLVNLPDEIIEDKSVFGKNYREIERYGDDLMISAVYCLGGSSIFDLTTTVHGTSVNNSLREEVSYLASDDAVEGFRVIRENNVFDENALNVLKSCNESAIAEAVAISYCRETLADWAYNSSYVGGVDILGSNDGVFYKFRKNLLYSAAMVSDKQVVDTFSTVVTILSAISEAESDAKGRTYYVNTALASNEELITKIQNELSDSGLYVNLDIYSCYDVMISSIASEIYDEGGYAYEERNQLFEDVAEAFNNSIGSDDESTKQIAAKIDALFSDFGAPLPANGALTLTRVMLDRINIYGYVSTWQISDFFYDYYYNSNYNGYITIN